MTVAMLVLGILTVLSSLGVILSPKPLHSALFLVLTLFFVAAHYALMGADFIAAVQVLVYAGAIMVLVVFVIMLLGMRKSEASVKSRLRYILPGLAAVCGFAGIYLGVRHGFSLSLYHSLPHSSENVVSGSTEAIGVALFTRFFYPLQIVGLLLLAAVIGAIVLAQEPKRPLTAGRGLRAKQTRDVMSRSKEFDD
jgi:NADH-quinone oxidoreductase subunit J